MCGQGFRRPKIGVAALKRFKASLLKGRPQRRRSEGSGARKSTSGPNYHVGRITQMGGAELISPLGSTGIS